MSELDPNEQLDLFLAERIIRLMEAQSKQQKIEFLKQFIGFLSNHDFEMLKKHTEEAECKQH